MSRFFTSSALSSMNLRRASTSSPISVVKMVSRLRKIFELAPAAACDARGPWSSPRAAERSSRPDPCSAAPGSPSCPAQRCTRTARARSASRPAHAESRALRRPVCFGLWPLPSGSPLRHPLSTAAAAAAWWRYSIRNGGSRYSLIWLYLAIIWRNSGLDASAQSIARSAPCASVKLIDQVWCSSSSTGSPSSLNCDSSPAAQLACAARPAWPEPHPALARCEVGAVDQLGARQHLRQLFVAKALVHLVDEAEILVERAHEAASARRLRSCWRASP